MALTKVQTIGIETGISLTGVTTVTTLNASTDTLSVGGTVNFGGNVSIAGTLTYEDVTNVDSVGIVTARDAIVLSDDNAIHFRGVVTDDADAILRASAGGGQLLINSRNDTIINIDSNNDSSDAHFAVAHGAATGSSTELFRVQEDGSIGVNTDSPLTTFHVARGSDDNSILYVTGADASSEFVALGVGANYGMLTAGGSGSTSTDLIIRTASSGTEAERMRIDSSGRLLVGATSSYGIADQVQIFSDTGVNLHRGSSNTGAARLDLSKSRNTTYGSNTIVQSGDSLGSILFRGDDGTDYTTPGGEIKVEVDGTPGANDMPGRLVFSTTADGAASVTERMRITSTARFGFNTSNPPRDYCFHSAQADTNIQITNNTTGVDDSAGSLIQQDGNDLYIWNKENSFMSLGTNASEKVRIDSNGEMGVGTSDPDAILHTSTNATDAVGLYLENRADTGSADKIGIVFALRRSGGYAFSGTRIRAVKEGSWTSTPSTIDSALTFDTYLNETASEKARLDSAGNFMVGKTSSGVATRGAEMRDGNSDYALTGTSDGHTVMLLNRNTSDGNLVIFRQANSQEGTISVSGSTITYGQFCGSHWGRLEDSSKPEILPGTILETVNKSVEWKVIEFTVDGVQKRQAYNGSAENGDIVTVEYEGVSYTGTVADEVPDSDALNKHVCVKVSDTAASKAVFGVFLGWDEEEEEGIIGAWNDMNIAALGNYFIRIKSGQTLEIGDLIESDGTGCGVVQNDDIIRSKTVAKVTSTTPQKVYTDGSFLVTCVLYSG